MVALGVYDVGELMTKQHSFTHGNRIYHMAVIDFLQEWNLQKRGERFIKTTLMGKNPDNLSAIEPQRYGERFRAFCENSVFVEKQEQQYS